MTGGLFPCIDEGEAFAGICGMENVVTEGLERVGTEKTGRRKNLHPDRIRRNVRRMLMDFVKDDRADGKSRLEAAKILISMVGARRRR